MTNTSLIEFLNTERLSFDRDVDLKTKTWIKRGGVAKLWIQPTQLSDFEKLIIWCQFNRIQFEVIGNTSNCYFLNSYNPELVISTLKLNEMQVIENSIICECGYNTVKLTKYCISHGIAGFEGFIGLPGTIGGAAINNSGCYGSLMSNVVQSVTILKNGEKITLTNEQMKYSHRNSSLKSKEINGVVTSVTFNIKHKSDPLVMEKLANEFNGHRKTFQEHVFPNLGSIFSFLEFKDLSFQLQLVNAIIRRILDLLIRDSLKLQKLKTKLFLILRGNGSFRKYVSDYGIGCFTWKDDGADMAFNEYIDFIRRHSKKAVIEIDIKGK